MKPRTHLAVGIGGAVLFSVGTGSLLSGFYFASVHVLTDLDHILDYVLWNRKKVTLHGFVNGKLRRALRLFHAIEWLLILLVLAYLFPSMELAAGVLGYGLHLGMDIWASQSKEGFFQFRKSPWYYFFIYRCLNSFTTDYKPYKNMVLALIERSGSECESCSIELDIEGEKATQMEFHHIVQPPVNDRANPFYVVALCRKCHLLVHDLEKGRNLRHRLISDLGLKSGN